MKTIEQLDVQRRDIAVITLMEGRYTGRELWKIDGEPHPKGRELWKLYRDAEDRLRELKPGDSLLENLLSARLDASLIAKLIEAHDMAGVEYARDVRNRLQKLESQVGLADIEDGIDSEHRKTILGATQVLLLEVGFYDHYYPYASRQTDLAPPLFSGQGR